jgi:hypothetical protein
VVDPDSGPFGGSTLPLLLAFVLALAFLGVVVAIGLSEHPDTSQAASTTETNDIPAGDLPTPRVTLILGTAGEGRGTVRVAGQPRVCTTECSFRIDQDTSVTIIARAAAGSKFVSWTGSCGGGRICTVTMDQARRATALFALPTDENAAQAPVPAVPDCTDGLDNDGDGFVDDADVECFTGDSEAGNDDSAPDLPGAPTRPPAPVAPPPVVIPPPPPPPPPFVAPPPPPPVEIPDDEVPPPSPAVTTPP